MAGSNAGFNPAAFRDAIHFAMTMGSPTTTAEKATFRWTRAQTFDPQDTNSRPYHWNQPVETDSTPSSVVLDNVAVEFAGNRSQEGNAVGEFSPLKAIVTLLDEEYALVEGADMVSLGGDSYTISITTVVALFGVDVYQMHCERG